MCGICGIVSYDRLTDVEVARVRRMQAELRHRGPDGEGFYSDNDIIMAMRRLSIIDLSGGWQPLYNEDRTLVLIANGEVYNFVELRSRLEVQGHVFRTGSDCETILHLYEEHGADFVQYLRGMYAIALWDIKRRRLHLVRDRMGEKPLYIYEKGCQLMFASELKALLRPKLVPFELDPLAIDLYFHYQYVPEPQTPVKGVRKLDAACMMTVNIDPWHVAETSYWRMEDAPPLHGNPAELLRDELEAVSKLTVRSDVPVGVALSGGLDSSAIAALAVSRYPGSMHAFSVGYPGFPPNDERKCAEALANHLGMPFHEVELAKDDMTAFFPELVYWRDDPIADISGYGYYAVMKLAREHGVPVILQGHGGDELFWGYSWVSRAVQETLQKANFLKKGYPALLEYLRPEQPSGLRPRALLRWVRNIFGIRSGWARFQNHKESLPEQMIFYDMTADFRSAVEGTRRLYAPDFVEELNGSNATALFSFQQPWPRVDLRLTRLICDTYLRENGIVQGDRLSMSSSIELRLPLLDYKLVETVIGLRKAQRDDHLPPKALFRAALSGILPDWVMNRPKRGFAPPVGEWYKALFTAYGENIQDGCLVNAGILNPASARTLVKGICPPGVVSPLSFKALVLEMWCRQMTSSA